MSRYLVSYLNTMKKILAKIDKGTPDKDRLLLVILFAVFAFVVVMDVAIMSEVAIAAL